MRAVQITRKNADLVFVEGRRNRKQNETKLNDVVATFTAKYERNKTNSDVAYLIMSGKTTHGNLGLPILPSWMRDAGCQSRAGKIENNRTR